MNRLHVLLILSIVLFFAGCGSTANLGKPLQQGIASWYGPNFHGKQTANGERFDQHAMTAAHKRLPFNTLVRVVHRETGKNIIVRINDRGPFVDNRIIDLSRKAAEEIGMIGSGTAPVRLYIVKGSANEIKESATSKPFTVQIASYTKKSQAKRKADDVLYGWVKSYRVDGRTVYRVYSGKFRTPEQANSHLKRLKGDNIDGFVKQI
jgi:rare lipoprotein A